LYFKPEKCSGNERNTEIWFPSVFIIIISAFCVLHALSFQVMGHMDVIAIISDGFNIYFPMLMIAFCLATYFSLGSRILSVLGIDQFIDEEIRTDLVMEGRDLITRGEIHSHVEPVLLRTWKTLLFNSKNIHGN